MELLRHHFEANWLLVEDLRGELGFRQLWTHLRTHRHPKTPYNGSGAYIWRWVSLLVHGLSFRVTTIKMMEMAYLDSNLDGIVLGKEGGRNI